MPLPRRTWLAFALLAGIVIAAACTGASGRDDRFAACYFAEQKVKQELLAPGDAKFESCRDRQVTRVGGDWVIRGWVDAPNVFGTRLRKEYQTTVRKADDGSGDRLVRLDWLR